MAATYQSTITMPACFAPVSQEEMAYLDGGAWFSFTRQDVINFGINLINNSALLLGSFSLSMGVKALTTAVKSTGSLAGGLGQIAATVAGFNGWQVAAMAVCGVCATYYAVVQISQMIALVGAVVDTVKQVYDTTVQQSQQGALAAA